VAETNTAAVVEPVPAESAPLAEAHAEPPPAIAAAEPGSRAVVEPAPAEAAPLAEPHAKPPPAIATAEPGLPVEAEPVEPPPVSEMPAEPALSAEAPTEEVEIDIWWPKDTGPFRREHRKPGGRPEHRHRRKERAEKKSAEVGKPMPDGQPPSGGKPQHRTGKPQRSPRPERRIEKPIDPDSPFAVLGALKAQLAKKT
jgi:ATP-dependent RNA helicase SUPV3L1/SUV3